LEPMAEIRTVPIERRKGERIPLRCPVEVEAAGGNVLRGQTINLSVSGTLVSLPAEIPLGMLLRVRLHLPDGQPPLELEALATRQERSPSGSPPVRIGFHFMVPPAEAVQRIRTLIYGT